MPWAGTTASPAKASACFTRFLAEAGAGRYPPSGSILSDSDYLPGAAIPSADYAGDILELYLREGSVASVQTKRGCPYRCVYCSYPALEGQGLRPRNPARVVDDVEMLVKNHGATYIFFTDSVFNDHEGRYLEVVREMKRRGLSVPWSAFFSPLGLAPADAALMKSTGLKAAEMGSDGACDATLEGQQKPFHWKDVVAANQVLRDAGVSVAHYFMFGGPGETPETVAEGVANIQALKCAAVFVFLGIRILPETELLAIARREGILPPDHDLLEPIYYFSPHVDRDGLERTLTEAFEPLSHVVFPPDKLDDKIRMLHKLGYTGTLWGLLEPFAGRSDRIDTMTIDLDRRKSIWCVIPAYNNGTTVKQVALECREHVPNVLVVDDGSDDADIEALFAGSTIQVLRHPDNRGKGAALRTALDHVARRDARFMITLDADGQHFPDDIELFIPALDDQRIVIGSRDRVVGAMPGKSRFGRKFSDFWVLLETGQTVSDTQSGFRAYPVRYLERLPLRCRRYDFEIEVLARAAWAGLELTSVPVRVWYPPREQRVTSFRPFLDNLRISLTHTRLIGRKLVPWPFKRLVPRAFSTLELFKRPGIVLRGLLRENATPVGLAASAAVSLFLATLPLIGLHMLAILYVTVRLNLNKVMALSIQNLCMPPVVPGICIAVGYRLRHGHDITHDTLGNLAREPFDRLLEWALGSLIVAPLLAGIGAIVVYMLAAWTRKRSGREVNGAVTHGRAGRV